MSIIIQFKKFLTLRKIHKLNGYAANIERASIACQRASIDYQEQALQLRIEAASMSRQLNKTLKLTR